MSTRQQTPIRRWGPLAAATLFTARVIWPWVRGRVIDIFFGIVLFVVVFVELLG